MRLVSGAGGTSGGSVDFSTAFASQTPSGTVGGTALTIAQLPAHNHGVTDPGHVHSVTDPGHSHTITRYAATSGGPNGPTDGSVNGPVGTFSTNSVGTGISIQSHTTGITTNNAGSGDTHTHTFTGNAINLAVKYANVILCSRN